LQSRKPIFLLDMAQAWMMLAEQALKNNGPCAASHKPESFQYWLGDPRMG
jgi:hypothetical protein